MVATKILAKIERLEEMIRGMEKELDLLENKNARYAAQIIMLTSENQRLKEKIAVLEGTTHGMEKEDLPCDMRRFFIDGMSKSQRQRLRNFAEKHGLSEEDAFDKALDMDEKKEKEKIK